MVALRPCDQEIGDVHAGDQASTRLDESHQDEERRLHLSQFQQSRSPWFEHDHAVARALARGVRRRERENDVLIELTEHDRRLGLRLRDGRRASTGPMMRSQLLRGFASQSGLLES